MATAADGLDVVAGARDVAVDGQTSEIFLRGVGDRSDQAVNLSLVRDAKGLVTTVSARAPRARVNLISEFLRSF